MSKNFYDLVDKEGWIQANRQDWFCNWIIPDRLWSKEWKKVEVVYRLETTLCYDFKKLNERPSVKREK